MDARTFDHELGIKCGLNADWNCEAWQITDGPTHRTDGAVFVLDEERIDVKWYQANTQSDTYSIVRRWFLGEDGSYCTSPGFAATSWWEERDLLRRDRARDPEAFDGNNDAIVVLAEGLSRSEMLAVVAFYRVTS